MTGTVDSDEGSRTDDGDQGVRTDETEPDAVAARDRVDVIQAGAIALVLSVIVNAALVTVASMAEIGEGLMAMTYPSVIVLTAVGVVGAVAVYLVLRSVTSRPDRAFLAVAVVALVLSVIPDFTYIPGQAGGSLTAGTVLALLHVTTAVIVVWLLVDRD